MVHIFISSHFWLLITSTIVVLVQWTPVMLCLLSEMCILLVVVRHYNLTGESVGWFWWEIKNKDFGVHQIFSSFSIYFIFVRGPPYFSSYSSSARFESVVPWVGVHRLLLHISWGVHLFYTVLAPTPFYRQILAPHLNDAKKGKKCLRYNVDYNPTEVY